MRFAVMALAVAMPAAAAANQLDDSVVREQMLAKSAAFLKAALD